MPAKKTKSAESGYMYCGCMCHAFKKKALGALAILVGLGFLFAKLNYIPELYADLLWPTVLIVVGFGMLIRDMCGCCTRGK